jgi:hypothetical protein
MRFFLFGLASTFVLSIAFADVADAQSKRQRSNDSRGECPVGTCNADGGQFAKDVKNCKASNCGRTNLPNASKKKS